MTLDRGTAANDGLALFTCADAVGHRQFNAWGSWQRIPGCSVSVFGDAPGVSDHARRFGFRSLPTVKRDEFGRPLLNWIFERMHDESTERVLGYVNSDIVLLPGLAASIAAVRAQFDAFLIVARRWNLEDLPALDFRSGWHEKLRALVTEHGELFTPYGIDLFVFKRGLLREIPAFALGSDYWDNYLVMRARQAGVPVIDVTPHVMLVHQNHALGRYRSANERRRGPEGLRAFALAGDSHALLGQTCDATHVVVDGDVKRAGMAHVTVVLPHRGETRWLCWWLRALEYQTYPQSFLSAIVVNTEPDVPLRYIEADFPTVRVLTEVTFGLAAARNKGISYANGEVIALFDGDTVLAADCLERAIQALREEPGCQVVACRVDPRFVSGRTTYIGRTVEWFDAVTHYNPNDWRTGAGAYVTSALIVRKSVFATCGYFTELSPEAAFDDWVRRLIAARVKVAFCGKAVVRQDTVRSIADLRRKKQRDARGECFLKALERSDTYRVEDVFRDEWRALRGCIRHVWSHPSIPSRYRAGALFVAVWSCLWSVRTKLRYRSEAPRVVRRRRRARDRPVLLRADIGTRGPWEIVRWLGHARVRP